jgi:hypothetical protein
METHEKRKLNRDKFLEFILGGKAFVTFKNSETNNRYTYKIRVSRDKKLYFVGVLYGSDNESNYAYIGCIFNNGTEFRWTKGSKINETDVRVKVFHYVFHHVMKGNLPECVEIWHEGKCARCGRTLTVPESIESGFGPECIRIMACA